MRSFRIFIKICIKIIKSIFSILKPFLIWFLNWNLLLYHFFFKLFFLRQKLNPFLLLLAKRKFLRRFLILYLRKIYIFKKFMLKHFKNILCSQSFFRLKYEQSLYYILSVLRNIFWHLKLASFYLFKCLVSIFTKER